MLTPLYRRGMPVSTKENKLARFTKSKLLLDLKKRADNKARKWNFDSNNGTAQLTERDIARAAEYGAWRKMLDLIEDIENGHIGI